MSKSMTRLRNILSLLLAATVLLFAMVEPAPAASMSECRRPTVFTGAYVNNYVKEFSDIADLHLNNEVARTGHMLAHLVQLDGLYSQIGYGPVGYIFVRTDRDIPEDCVDEAVIDGVKRNLMPGHGYSLLSGNFEQLDQGIYLLSTINFGRLDVVEEIDLNPAARDGEPRGFILSLPETSISFSPRRFSEEQLLEVLDIYKEHMKVWKDETFSEVIHRIDPTRYREFSYSVNRISDDGFEIESHTHWLPSGWMRAPENIGDLGLRDLLPELYFMDAVAMYLQIRVSNRWGSNRLYNNVLQHFEHLLNEFAERANGAGDRRALGVLKTMHVALITESPEGVSLQDMRRISEIAQEAAALIPTSRNAGALTALVDFMSTQAANEQAREKQTVELQNQLLTLLSTDPNNKYLRASLERVWRLPRNNETWETNNIRLLRQRFDQDRQVQKLLD